MNKIIIHLSKSMLQKEYPSPLFLRLLHADFRRSYIVQYMGLTLRLWHRWRFKTISKIVENVRKPIDGITRLEDDLCFTFTANACQMKTSFTRDSIQYHAVSENNQPD